MKALVIAGSIPQIELIKQLKERKIETVLVDGSNNCLAKAYADVFYQADIFDIDKVKEIALREKVDFLLTVCADQVLLVVAQVSELLGLPCYIDYETAQNVSDKIKMKKVFLENDVPTSKFIQISELNADSVEGLRYPLVVKPVDAYSSKGVRKAETYEELEAYYKEASEISRTGGVIIEEYCKGEEISVDAFIVDGKAHVLCISNSDKILDDGRFVIFRGRTPANVDENIVNQIKVVAQRITDAFKLKNSPLLIQMINNGKSVSVLEFCARTGGNMKWLLIKHSCGVDVIRATIDITLGQIPDISPKENCPKYVANDFLYCRDGVFDRPEGFAELQQKGVINEFFAIRQSGWKITGIKSSSDRILGFNITGDTLEEINRKQNIVSENTKILDKNGNDIMRHDLIPDCI